MALSESTEKQANESLGGRVKINASKHLVRQHNKNFVHHNRGFDRCGVCDTIELLVCFIRSLLSIYIFFLICYFLCFYFHLIVLKWLVFC